MVLLSSLNEQRAAVGASQVYVPGVSPAPNTPPKPVDTSRITVDPTTRTYSGPGAADAGAQSAANRGAEIYTAPTARSGQQAVDSQNALLASRRTDEPQEVTTFNPTGAKLLQGYTPEDVNRYVNEGRLTQEQATTILQKSTLSPDEALALGLGKKVTVTGQKGMQELIKSNLQIRQQEAAADLAAGKITQDEYNSIAGDVNKRLSDADRLIAAAQNPYTAATASGTQSSRLDQIDNALAVLNSPQQYDNYLSFLTHEDIAKVIADREKQKTALQQERAALLAKQKSGNQNFQSYGGGMTTTPDGRTMADSRASAVQGLMQQGITDPRQILDFLNFTQDGQQVGDFTLAEVQQLMNGGGRPGGQQMPRPTTTRAAIESLIGRVTPEQGKFLQGALTLLDQRMAESGQNYQDDAAAADAEFNQFQDIAGDMLKRADSVQAIASTLARRQAADDEAAAERAKQSALAQNETERQMTALKLNEQKRQIELASAKKINSMSNRLAIAGGFGSMGGIKAIEDAQFEGERALASFVNEIALTDQQYLDRAIGIDATYTGQVAQIHRGYSDSLLQIVTKYNDRVDEVQKLLIGSSQARATAIATARNRARDDWDKLHEKTLSLLGDAVKETTRKAEEVRKEQYTKGKDNWNQAMQYVTAYGTQNKDQLSNIEDNLGLPAGTLSKYKTLAEMRMIRYSGNGTPSGGESVKNYVDSVRAQVIRAHPDWDGEKVDTAVLETTQSNYSGTKNNNFRIGVQNYVNDNNYKRGNGDILWSEEGVTPVNDEPYFVGYKFHPTIEQNVYSLDDDLMGALSGL